MSYARRKEARRRIKQPRGEWREADPALMTTAPGWMTRAYQNNRFTVMVNDTAKLGTGTAICAMVQAHDRKPIPGHWAELQRIKNELFGAEATGIEFYPPVSKLIDDQNIYWLWIFPHGVGIVPVDSQPHFKIEK